MERMFNVYNVVGGKHLISNEAWTVSLVRKKAGHGAEHAFLIIEGLYQGNYKIVRADLFVKEGAPLGSSALFGESGLKGSNYAGNASAKTLPGSSGQAVLFASNASGQAMIKMKELMLDELEALAGQCEYKTYGITAEQAETLISQIEKDVGAKLGYNLFGDGSVYSASFLSQRFHSCVSWAIEKLRQINIKVEGTWHDFILVKTSKILPAAKQENVPQEEQTTGVNRCSMM